MNTSTLEATNAPPATQPKGVPATVHPRPRPAPSPAWPSRHWVQRLSGSCVGRRDRGPFACRRRATKREEERSNEEAVLF